jgi:tetratricopeptide (TPR) repeat protein
MRMFYPGNDQLLKSRQTASRVAAFLKSVFLALGRLRRTTWLALGLLVIAVSIFGFYAYALRQWHAAQAAVKQDRLDEAQNDLDLCLFVWPRSIEVHLLAARAARLKGDFHRAELHLNRCMKLQPGASEAIQLEFLLMRVQGGEEDEVASELMVQYVNVGSPESEVILETLARAFMRNLRYGPAYDCLCRWIEVAPDSAEPYQWRGWVLERVNDHNGAMEDYRRAVDLNPDLIAARLRLAEMLLEMSKIPEAVQHLERLSQQAPERRDVMARLGQCRFAQGEPEEARRMLEVALEGMPKDPGALVTLAKIELQEKHAQKSEEYLRRALKVDPTDPEAGFVLAAALQAQDRWSEANAALEEHKKNTELVKDVGKILNEEAKHPTRDPAPLCKLGEVFLKTNEQIGLYWLHRALERDPSHEQTHKILAEFYDSKGSREKAAFHRKYLKADNKS